MMADDQIDTLNSLLRATIDSVKGYENSAQELDSNRLREIFRQCADERQNVVQRLREEVRRLGGDPADSGSAMGSMHHVWEDLKGAVTGKDEEATINQTEAAEDYLKEQFEDAMKNLTGESRHVVEQCYQQVRQGHDQISALKHGMEAHS
jgi:uncharacterized protein (TIGR02284 family)